MFRGHPSTAAYLRLVPVGLDTAQVNRQILTLAAKSGLTLGEVVHQWNLAVDYPAARKALASLSVDTASLNPFQLDTPLHLDTLHLGEPAVGLVGKIRGKKGIKEVKFVIENDSGDRSDRFVLADAPDLKSSPERMDFAGHPTFAPRANAALGSYTLRLHATDSVGNVQTYSTTFKLAGALDHSGPKLTVLDPVGSVVRDFDNPLLTVKVAAVDSSGVKSVQIDGKDAKRGLDGNWSIELTVPVSATSQVVLIQAKDSVDNTSETQIHIRRNEAPVPTVPRLTLVGPANGTLVPFDSAGVWVEWRAATDFGKIETVTIDGKPAKLEDEVWRLWVALAPDGKLVNLPVKAQSSVPLSITEFVSVGRKADSAGPLVQWGTPGQGHRVAYDTNALDVSVSVSDASGLDSVRIEGKKPDTAAGQWKATIDLAGPGEITRIHVKAWDRLGNGTDSVLLVSRDQIPGQLPPALTWKSPSNASGTVIPFAEAKYLVQCVLTDISGVESASVRINGVVATQANDSVWEHWVDLPPDGKAQIITLEAKNKRGISVSGFVSVARAPDSEKPIATKLEGTKDQSVLFDSSSVEVGWNAKDNDRIAQAWIQDTLVTADATGYHLRVSLAVATQWIKFRAVDPEGNEVRDSVSVERRTDTVKAVTFSDTNGKLRSGSFWVKLSCATPGAKIRFTRNGTDPTSADSIYADSIQIDTTITLKARGFAAGRVDGPVVEQGYQLAVPVKVFGGSRHTLVIMSDSSLWGFGENNCNAIGGNTGCKYQSQEYVIPPRKLAESVVHAAASPYASSWVQSDGTLWALGSNTLGSAGVGDDMPVLTPALVTRGVAKVRRPRIGNGSLVLKRDGSLWGTGSNGSGALGLGSMEKTNQLVKIADGVEDMGFGATFGYFGYFRKTDGTLWGMGVFPALGLNSRTPVKLLDSVAVLPEQCSNTFIFTKMDGSVWGGGDNSNGQLGLGHQDPVTGLVQLSEFKGKEVQAIAMGERHSLLLLKSGEVYGMGDNAFGQLPGNQPGSVVVKPVKLFDDAIAVACGSWNSEILGQNGVLMSYGANPKGQLGGGVLGDVAQTVRVRF
ncbi:MAG: chitobiase/beta-hexosaminidase C-terminal domain-containing protein [Fibrobacteres bacterium]|nr:chitobiase/beta-hexosaminidase C-terminal domain-containing protein [Fibrobacterota bacterium]